MDPAPPSRPQPPAHVSALLQPVEAQARAGVSATTDRRYDELRRLVLALENPSHGVAHWETISSLGQELLTSKSKDLTIACYTAGAWTSTEGLAGFAAACHLLAGLIDDYWDVLFPPVQRRRGRVNALAWFVDRSVHALGRSQHVATASEVEAARQALQTLAERARARLEDDCPGMGDLEQTLSRLRLNAVPDPAENAAAPIAAPVREDEAPSSPQPMDEQDATAAAVTKPNAAATAAAATPSSAAAALATSAPASSHEGEPGGEAPAPATAGLASPPPPVMTLPTPARDWSGELQEVRDFLIRTGRGLLTVAEALFAADRGNPASYRLRRQAIWLHIDAPPASDADGTTKIPDFPSERREKLERLARHERLDVLLVEAEGSVSEYPLHLDLHRIVHETLLGLNLHAAARAVADAVEDFGRRHPSLLSLRSAGGQPLADETTRRWLAARSDGCASKPHESSRANQTGGRSSQPADPASWKPVDDLVREGKLEEALRHLGDLEPRHRRARFERLLAFAEQLGGLGRGGLARHLFQALEREVSEHRLDIWEPPLAVRCWQGILLTAREHDDTTHTLERLFSVDPAAAVEFSST